MKLLAEADAIAWDQLPRVNSSELFYRIKEFLVAEKASGQLLATGEDLYARLLRQHPNLGDSEELRSQFNSANATTSLLTYFKVYSIVLGATALFSGRQILYS